VGENVKIFNLFCKTLHSQRTFNVAFNGSVDSLIEIDTGCTVDNYVDCIDNELPIFWRKSYVLFFQISLNWPYFFFDELIKAVTVLVSDSVEACTADHLFFESFIKIETFLASDENVDDLDLRERKEEFLK